MADYFVGNTIAVLSIGFQTGKSVDFPITLCNEDIRKLTQPTCKVLAIFRKEYNDNGAISLYSGISKRLKPGKKVFCNAGTINFGLKSS